MSNNNAIAKRIARVAGSKYKWFLGGGRRVLWAPEFPLFLDRPGFWDPGTYLEVKLSNLFTYTLLEDGRAIEPVAKRRHWQPDGLTTTFSGGGLNLTETKSVSLDDAFVGELAIQNTRGSARTIDVVLWGLVDATDIGDITFGPVKADRNRIAGEYHTHDATNPKGHDIRLTWRLDPTGGRASACTSYAVQGSERTADHPDWRLSPFYELFDGKALPNTCHWRGGIEHRPDQPPHRKMVYIALHRRVRLAARGRVTLVGQCQVASIKHPPKSRPRVDDWQGYFDAAPEFRCSDPYIEKYFDYRLYGLRLNAIDYGRDPLPHPCVFEGINPGWFRHAISYSAQVLAKDCRWLNDPDLARGCILNFIETQADSGFIFGGLLTEKATEDWQAGSMYHADWGGAVEMVHAVHPDRRFLEQCYAGFARYAEWFDRERDAEGTGLYDVRSQAETGQEYMSRYLFVDPRADEWGPIRLKGVDATVYVYKLLRSLAWMARELGDESAANNWTGRAEKVGQAILTKMWDPRRQKFCDVDPKTGKRSPVKALTDFYPFLTDLVTKQHLVAIREHLLNPKEFWTPWPAPSTSLDDKTADAYGRWLGKRKMCPWNGRTWLMTNSHIAEVLALSAQQLDPKLARHAVSFMQRFIQMMFVDRDLEQPTSYEYYNPITGQAPFFRATDDYMHSYVVDLIVRFVAGVQPGVDGTLRIAPLDFGLDRFSLTNCTIAGRAIEVKWDGKNLTAKVGQERQRTAGLGPLEFTP